jgi:hypothetical protein
LPRLKTLAKPLFCCETLKPYLFTVMTQVGVCYISGKGVESSEESAAAMFQKAAEMGEATAQVTLYRNPPVLECFKKVLS